MAFSPDHKALRISAAAAVGYVRTHIYTHRQTKESHIYIVNEAQTLASQNVDRLMLLLHTGDFSSDLVLLFIYIRFHLKHTTRGE